MPETKKSRAIYPTHIPSLDKVLGGGMPTGSTVLLMSEPGAGGGELLQTYVMNYCSAKLRQEPAPKGTTYPQALYYISSTESRDNFNSSVADLFKVEEDEYFAQLMENIHYTDLGGNYFSGTHVPYEWYGSKKRYARTHEHSTNRRLRRTDHPHGHDIPSPGKQRGDCGLPDNLPPLLYRHPKRLARTHHHGPRP